MKICNPLFRADMPDPVHYKIDRNNRVLFNNHVDFCIGTGRMGLALQKEYLEQLRLVQEEIGFKHIRGSDHFLLEGEYHAAQKL